MLQKVSLRVQYRIILDKDIVLTWTSRLHLKINQGFSAILFLCHFPFQDIFTKISPCTRRVSLRNLDEKYIYYVLKRQRR